MRKVFLSKKAIIALHKVPLHIATKLKAWVDLVENHGLEYTRKIPGFHDEPLKGDRKGQRSIRLSKAYRAIYIIEKIIKIIKIENILVIEVNKHEY